MPDDLPVMEFKKGVDMREWLVKNHSTSMGIWIRVFHKRSGVESVTFEELLDEGLCFGWSESMRRVYDDVSYLQRFTPRKKMGTVSTRNLDRVELLKTKNRMTDAGFLALGITGKEVNRD